MLANILAWLDESACASAAIEHAVALGNRHRACVRALTVADTRGLIELLATCESAVFSVAEQQRLTESDARCHAAHRALARACLAAGINFDVRRDSGDPVEHLVREARYHDLVVAAFPLAGADEAGLSGEPVPNPQLILDAALAGARPLLIVRRPPLAASRVLLVYDGTLASGRAIRTFLQQRLWEAAACRLLAVGGSEGDALALQREMRDACRALAADLETGAVCGSLRRILVPYIERWEPDLVVLGSDRTHPLLRRVFGDAARDVLVRTSSALYLGA